MSTQITISDTAKSMLIGAGETGLVPPARIPPAALRSLATSLLKNKLVRTVKPADGAMQVTIEGEPRSLKVTAAGFRAVGLEPTVPAEKEAAPAKPRDTKQARVITMLQRKEGATVLQIAEATGWQHHTVRGFFAGLKKKGIEVAVLDRVRKVGPNQNGSKGSYTVYRVEA